MAAIRALNALASLDDSALLVLSNFHRLLQSAEIVQALATLTIPALIGPVVGPPLGGFITTYFDWRWIFFINIPIGILGIVLSTLYIPNIREEDVPRLDVAGFLISALGGSRVLRIDVSVADRSGTQLGRLTMVRPAPRTAT